MTERVRSHVIGRSPASGHTPASASPYVSLTGRTLPASGAFRPSVRSVDRRQRLRDQLVFTSNFFTLAPMCQPQELASGAIENRHSIFLKAPNHASQARREGEKDPNPSQHCKHHLLCKCANTTKYITLCTCVSVFSQIFSRVLALH